MKIDQEYLMRMKASIADSTTDFIGIADAGGKLIYLNDGAYKMMGYGPGERPEFETIADVHANDFDKFALEVVQPAVMEHGSWSGTGYLRHKDGSAVSVAQSVFPVYDDGGTFYGTAAVMKDISGALQMDAQMKRTSQLFQKVLDSSKIGITLINMETKTIEMVNRFTQELLQMEEGEIVGQKCYDILCHMPPDICPHVNEREIPTIVAERFIERSDGSFVPIIKSGTWIDIDGHEYLVDTFVDITVQKELEKKLVEAKISAEAANRSKSEFLSRMSHEMRTPLNAVIGMTQIAGRTDSVEKLKDAIQTIEVSSMHLLGLINDVLDLSKIEEGKLELSIEPFSPHAMVQKILSLISARAEEKDIAFTVQMDENIPEMLVGDSMRLSQVLLNFLSNAVKFTAEGGRVSLDAQMRELKDGNATLHFAVTDNGIGISDEQLTKLFQPFVQADGSISRKFGGTGLGLVISRRILDLMDSEIDVDTTFGEGTCFSFDVTLPVSEQRHVEAPEYDAERIMNIFAGKRVLIVDDLQINRVIAAELLSVTGIETDEAEDGMEAVHKVEENHYDIILMDVQMPVMDGYEATRQIRAMEGPAGDTVIVAMSANVFKEDVERSMAVGMQAHIGKPVDMYDMIATMDRVLFSPDQEEKKAPDCEGLIQELAAAVDRRDRPAAAKLAKRLQEATRAAMPAVSSYAGNVYEWLERDDFDYAAMYLTDLIKTYKGVSGQ